jgi:hypothetical protein
MVDVPASQRVEVTFVGTPPTRQIEQAQGVGDVHVEGRTVRCVIYGSFQPFLEALRGYEVVGLTATPVGTETVAPAPRSEA